MKQLIHWSGKGTVTVGESKGGVLATVNPLDNLVRHGVTPWPPPEIIQKLYASSRWSGKTDDDDLNSQAVLGHYCDLQSLNSEDAITWSFFGPLVYGPQSERTLFANSLLEQMGFPTSDSAAIWLWRRIPHPEKPASSGGPEIDFGIQTDRCFVLGEAKWNSSIGGGQGVEHNRTQLELRLAYCTGIGLKALASIENWAVVGVGRSPDVLMEDSRVHTTSGVKVYNTTWSGLLDFMPTDLKAELTAYLAWKIEHSKSARRISNAL